ncbi:outer membrane protein assembly factor BamB family protein [Candidatus Roseilinea sp. NK_OTU-006]|jgi:outer membrane protein assembly factor BamB|uniref:outer membrane protein assembly factor BamB family protein n=1 Tax=Candidatus Roseilinea sp. NK_OTU-006 TaxID=2704250 RepID=UPI001981401F|nr:PQQ-binding-like beta-propeller repeat protein [Candidatus Roseilinea sp. NK_OTU-006]
MKKISLLALLVFSVLLGFRIVMRDASAVAPAQATPTPSLLYLPLTLKSGGAITEWNQHAHDAQRTGYAPQAPAYPWKLRWIWNGVSPSGGVSKVTTGGTLPRNVQPVTGEGRVYIAAGNDGVFALSETTGQQLWQRNGIGDVRSTVAYDPDTQSVFVVSANGRLYKLRASDGTVLAQFITDQANALPLPPALFGDRVVFAMGRRVHAVNKLTLQGVWTHTVASTLTVAVPPAYSPSRDLIFVATEPDLFVRAIRNSDGGQQWASRPVPAGCNFGDPTQFRYGWPVVAENAGYVLVKVRLPWQRLWIDWPQTNAGMRQLLQDNPCHRALFALDLDDGGVPFIANVGHGGYGDNDYLPMGPQPVVKRLPSGKDVVYIIIRAKHAYDERWDSHFGEMVLDSSTVSGLQAGDVRFIAFDWPPGDSNPYLLTDEQPNVSVAGDYLFGGHWEAGFALRILDRSDVRGSFSNKITSQRLSTVATSQDVGGCTFNAATHYCAAGLYNTRPYDFGFYIYYGQGSVYDQYWSEYATWVVSNDALYFRSADGAIVALTSGNPQMPMAQSADHVRDVHRTVNTPSPYLQSQISNPKSTIDYAEARAWAGQTVTVTGALRYVFNNGKQVLLGFSNPHQGSFKAIIAREHWRNFPAPPEQMYRVGQWVAIVGTIGWYQGDPAIRVAKPQQVQQIR